jgi:GNAT superfamily N-acetyltransferase
MHTPPSCSAALAEDAEEIARLSAELGYPVRVDQIRATLARLLPSPVHFVAVVRHGDRELAGWVVAERRLKLASGESVEITGLVVSASLRRTGVGQALLAAVVDWARNTGFGSVRVCSNIVRQASHPFYRRLGFQLVKTQHVYEYQLNAGETEGAEDDGEKTTRRPV